MSAEQSVVLPERAGSRREARAYLDEVLPIALEPDSVVYVNGEALAVSAPSYLDELVKIVLVERRASRLVLRNAPERAAIFIVAAAQRRNVAGQVEVRPAK